MFLFSKELSASEPEYERGQAVVLNHGLSHAFLSDMLMDGLHDTRPWALIMQERLEFMEKGTPASNQAFKLASAAMCSRYCRQVQGQR